MADPVLHGPTPARQLGLPDPDDRVAVVINAAGSPAGATWIDLPSLRSLLAGLPDTVELLVVGDEIDPAGRERIAAMLDAMGDSDALACYQPVSEALKEVEGGLVIRSVDRTELVATISPEIIRLPTLVRALRGAQGERVVSLTGLIAAAGGHISLFEAG